MPYDGERFYIISGPEGAGKTTLTHTLARRGMATMVESTREVWRYQDRIGGPYLPFSGGTQLQKQTYFEMSLALDMRTYEEALAMTQGPVIFDRGMPDIAVFLKFCGLPVPAHVDRAIICHRYNSTVFMAPFWPEIYEQDSERTSTPEEAAAQEELCRGVYEYFGYKTVMLPKAAPEERADFVIKHIKLDQAVRAAMRDIL